MLLFSVFAAVANGITYKSEFPDDSSVHRTFGRWEQNGILDRIWAALVEECEEFGAVNWQWQSADAAMALIKIWWR